MDRSEDFACFTSVRIQQDSIQRYLGFTDQSRMRGPIGGNGSGCLVRLRYEAGEWQSIGNGNFRCAAQR